MSWRQKLASDVIRSAGLVGQEEGAHYLVVFADLPPSTRHHVPGICYDVSRNPTKMLHAVCQPAVRKNKLQYGVPSYLQKHNP